MVRVSCVVLAVVVSVSSVQGAGEAVRGFPNWEERVMHQLMNRARVAPATELAGCGANCSAAELSGCYAAVAPLPWNSGLGQAARFHSAAMGKNTFFSHSTPFVIRNDIASVFPETCDGSSACASVGQGTTGTATRVSLFGASYSGEIIAAGYYSPSAAFYAWLWEPAQNAPCGFTTANGHRYLILRSGPSVGTGFSTSAVGYGAYWTGDFGGTGSSGSKIVSGTHWGSPGSTAPEGRQSSSVDFWANWYDAAAPLRAEVVVDGVARTMALARGTSSNGAWMVSVGGLASGCHRYYFLFQDSAGNSVRYPTTGTLGVGGSSCADYSAAAVLHGDSFDASSTADLIWRNTNTGQNALWFMSGATVSDSRFVTGAGFPWDLEATGDLNHDGQTDLVWRNYETGANAVWYMNGSAIQGTAYLPSIPSAWRLAGSADFNADGFDDLVWRNVTTGENALWYMNGASVINSVFINGAALSWTLEGTGDFDSNGSPDLVWRNYTTGQNAIWFMSDRTVTGSAYIASIPVVWDLEASGDFDGNGTTDLLFRNYSTGQNAMWFLNGSTIVNTVFISSASVEWRLEGGR